MMSWWRWAHYATFKHKNKTATSRLLFELWSTNHLSADLTQLYVAPRERLYKTFSIYNTMTVLQSSRQGDGFPQHVCLVSQGYGDVAVL